MQESTKPGAEQYITVRVPPEYNFYDEVGTGMFDVNFEDLFSLYTFDRLDANIMRVWTLHMVQEIRRLNANVGLIDPYLFNWRVLNENPEMITQFIAKVWLAQRTKDYIMFAYNPP